MPPLTQVGPDLMVLGYLPTSNGPRALHAMLTGSTSGTGGGLAPTLKSATDAAVVPSGDSGTGSGTGTDAPSDNLGSISASASGSIGAKPLPHPSVGGSGGRPRRGNGAGMQRRPYRSGGSTPASLSATSSGLAGSGKVATFYKAWDKWGALGNFSPHEVELPAFEPAVSASGSGSAASETVVPPRPTMVYRSVEHYYQASKFSGATEEGRKLSEEVRCADAKILHMWGLQGHESCGS